MGGLIASACDCAGIPRTRGTNCYNSQLNIFTRRDTPIERLQQTLATRARQFVDAVSLRDAFCCRFWVSIVKCVLQCGGTTSLLIWWEQYPRPEVLSSCVFCC